MRQDMADRWNGGHGLRQEMTSKNDVRQFALQKLSLYELISQAVVKSLLLQTRRKKTTTIGLKNYPLHYDPDQL